MIKDALDMDTDSTRSTPLPKLLIASGEASFDLFYRTRFLTPDPVIYIETPTTRSLLLSDLEVDRGKKQATVDEVVPTRTFEERLKANGKRANLPAIAALFLKDRHFDRVLVPFDLASGYSRALESEGIEIVVSDGELYPQRALKNPEEIRWVRETQIGVEESLEIALELLRKAEIREGLIWVDGEYLTSERVKSVLKQEMLKRNLLGRHTIVAGGEQACDPHMEGTGPLPAHLPIVFDIFPSHEETRYYSDMTRTFFKGAVSPELKRNYQAVLDAQNKAIDLAGPGVDSKLLHEAVVAHFSSMGYPTGIRPDGRMEGFFHGTGHGVGLEIHEAPRVGRSGELLAPGHIITVEPGLYYPGVGGIRIEDMLAITETGAQNLTTFPKTLKSAIID